MSDFPSTINKIAVYNGSGVTREWGPAMLTALRSVYPRPDKIELVTSHRTDQDDVLYIIICPAGLNTERVNFPKYYIIWQLEFLSGYVFNTDKYRGVIQGALRVWEYSPRNFEFVRMLGHEPIHVTPGYIEAFSRPEVLNGQYLYDDAHKDVEVSFLGWTNAIPRRRELQDAMFKAGIRTWFVCELTPDGMSDVIRRSKICLNIMAKDEFPLATIRLNFLLSNVACVVSERSMDPDLDSLFESKGVAFTTYQHIITVCQELLKDFPRRRDMAVKSHQWLRKERRFVDQIDFASLLPSL